MVGMWCVPVHVIRLLYVLQIYCVRLAHGTRWLAVHVWCTYYTFVHVDYLGARYIVDARLLLVPLWKYCAS